MLYVMTSDDANPNIFKSISMIGSGAIEAASKVEISGNTIQKAFGVIKAGASGLGGAFKGLWSSLGFSGKIGLVIAGITAIVKAWNWLDNTLVITAKAADKKMEEAFDEYKSAKENVESLTHLL